FTIILQYVVDAITKLQSNNTTLVVYALTFAQKWNFTREEAIQISQKLLDYYNNDPPFNLKNLEPQTYWKQISYQAGALKILALKIFAIPTSTLKMISQIRLALSAEISKKKLDKKLVTEKENDNISDNYNTLFSYDLIDLMNEEDNELEFNHIQEIYLESLPDNSNSFMEDFINFDIIDELILTSDEVKKNLDETENTTNWTLDEILKTNK
ncbi:9022_t:CDS:2, partial [Gigaspora margarita]